MLFEELYDVEGRPASCPKLGSFDGERGNEKSLKELNLKSKTLQKSI